MGADTYTKLEEEADEGERSTPALRAPARSDSMLSALKETFYEASSRRSSIRVEDSHRSWVTSDNPSRNTWDLIGELRGTAVQEDEEDQTDESPSFNDKRLPKGKGGGDDGGSLLEGDGKEDPFKAKHPILHWVSLRWWPGANLWALAVCIALGIVVKFVWAKPDQLTDQAWSMLAIFVATIAGLILEPLPTGGVAYVAMTFVLVTGLLDFKTAFMSFTNDTIWLIVSAFFFARGVEKTGLGERLANYFIRLFGTGALGLSYAVVISETVVAAAMPSTTARAGGIFVPILSNLAKQFDSYPRDKSARRLGAYLLMSQFQAGINSSAMFLTGAAQNSLCITLAEEQGVTGITWTSWFKNAVLPASIGVALTPLLVYLIYPPQLKKTPEAKGDAKANLANMGKATWDEWVMGAVLLLAIGLWIGGGYLPVPMGSTTVAFLAMSLLLLTGVLTWRDCISYAPAWDTLFWFGVLIGFSSQLNALGVIDWMADSVAAPLAAKDYPAYVTLLLVLLIYFVIHYMFASQTAHVTALYPAFLAILLKLGISPQLSALSLAYTTNLFGSITHYAAGQAAVFYGEGYLGMQTILLIGFIFAVFNLALWLGPGVLWWKLMGLYDTIYVGAPVEMMAPTPAPM